MNRKIMIIGIFLFALQAIVMTAKSISASAGPPPHTDTGGWYYHDNTGTRLGYLTVDSTSLDINGTAWNAQ